MDLLRQVLARLPLQRILDFKEGIIDNELFIATRSRVVNGVPNLPGLDKLDDLGNYYVIMCDVQGEPSDVTMLVIPKIPTYSRAAFLREKLRYRYPRSIPADLDIDLILASDDKDIIIPALMASRNPYAIFDPEIVNWQPELVAFYTKKILETPASSRHLSLVYLAGYLHIPLNKLFNWGPFSKNLLDYTEMYILSEMTNHSDPLAIIPGLDRFLRNLPFENDSIAELAIRSGYLGFDFSRMDPYDVRKWATEYIQPKLLRSLPRKGPLRFANRAMKITHHVAERAGEMVSLILEQYPKEIEYLTEMRVIAGQTIDLKVLDFFSELGKAIISADMCVVAHPQLSAEFLRQNDDKVISTSVRYDIVNYFRQSRLLSRPVSDRDLHLYSTGKLLECFRSGESNGVLAAVEWLRSSY